VASLALLVVSIVVLLALTSWFWGLMKGAASL